MQEGGDLPPGEVRTVRHGADGHLCLLSTLSELAWNNADRDGHGTADSATDHDAGLWFSMRHGQ